jgi:hypothetical protein
MPDSFNRKINKLLFIGFLTLLAAVASNCYANGQYVINIFCLVVLYISYIRFLGFTLIINCHDEHLILISLFTGIAQIIRINVYRNI